jgi:HlyD family secretion protein
MKKLLFILIVLWGGGAAGYWYWTEARNQRVVYRTVPIRRGDLLATINATGTLEPEDVVDVGVQVAGILQSFGTDPRDPSKPIGYGSPTEEGTVLARLDDALFKARVAQMNANVAKAEADVKQSQSKVKQSSRELDRVQRLLQSRAISPQEHDNALAAFETAKATLAVSESSVALAKANLDEATINLGYTTIRSPVKGVIVDRRVNIGQTVMASPSAPSLFLIARDLSRMEIWASVNETDVGAIHEGQGVRFTVGAFPHDTFRGKVAQIRLNASMTQSVVTYTVVISVENTSGKLLPYLTARVQFEVEERTNALRVPNAALRWEPKIQHVAPDARDAFATELRQRAAAPRGEKTRPRLDSGPGSGVPGTVWVRSGEFVRPVAIRVGVTDGILSEIVSGEVRDGTEVILGQVAEENDEEGGSPFLPKLKNDKAKK